MPPVATGLLHVSSSFFARPALSRKEGRFASDFYRRDRAREVGPHGFYVSFPVCFVGVCRRFHLLTPLARVCVTNTQLKMRGRAVMHPTTVRKTFPLLSSHQTDKQACALSGGAFAYCSLLCFVDCQQLKPFQPNQY